MMNLEARYGGVIDEEIDIDKMGIQIKKILPRVSPNKTQNSSGLSLENNFNLPDFTSCRHGLSSYMSIQPHSVDGRSNQYFSNNIISQRPPKKVEPKFSSLIAEKKERKYSLISQGKRISYSKPYGSGEKDESLPSLSKKSISQFNRQPSNINSSPLQSNSQVKTTAEIIQSQVLQCKSIATQKVDDNSNIQISLPTDSFTMKPGKMQEWNQIIQSQKVKEVNDIIYHNLSKERPNNTQKNQRQKVLNSKFNRRKLKREQISPLKKIIVEYNIDNQRSEDVQIVDSSPINKPRLKLDSRRNKLKSELYDEQKSAIANIEKIKFNMERLEKMNPPQRRNSPNPLNIGARHISIKKERMIPISPVKRLEQKLFQHRNNSEQARVSTAKCLQSFHLAKAQNHPLPSLKESKYQDLKENIINEKLFLRTPKKQDIHSLSLILSPKELRQQNIYIPKNKERANSNFQKIQKALTSPEHWITFIENGSDICDCKNFKYNIAKIISKYDILDEQIRQKQKESNLICRILPNQQLKKHAFNELLEICSEKLTDGKIKYNSLFLVNGQSINCLSQIPPDCQLLILGKEEDKKYIPVHTYSKEHLDMNLSLNGSLQSSIIPDFFQSFILEQDQKSKPPSPRKNPQVLKPIESRQGKGPIPKSRPMTRPIYEKEKNAEQPSRMRDIIGKPQTSTIGKRRASNVHQKKSRAQSPEAKNIPEERIIHNPEGFPQNPSQTLLNKNYDPIMENLTFDTTFSKIDKEKESAFDPIASSTAGLFNKTLHGYSFNQEFSSANININNFKKSMTLREKRVKKSDGDIYFKESHVRSTEGKIRTDANILKTQTTFITGEAERERTKSKHPPMKIYMEKYNMYENTLFKLWYEFMTFKAVDDMKEDKKRKHAPNPLVRNSPSFHSKIPLLNQRISFDVIYKYGVLFKDKHPEIVRRFMKAVGIPKDENQINWEQFLKLNALIKIRTCRREDYINFWLKVLDPNSVEEVPSEEYKDCFEKLARGNLNTEETLVSTSYSEKMESLLREKSCLNQSNNLLISKLKKCLISGEINVNTFNAALNFDLPESFVV